MGMRETVAIARVTAFNAMTGMIALNVKMAIIWMEVHAPNALPLAASARVAPTVANALTIVTICPMMTSARTVQHRHANVRIQFTALHV